MTVFVFESVYLARHGQTRWNLQGRRQGRLDSPLTAEGVLQVRRNAQSVRSEPIDAVFTSPLGRARESASVFASVLGAPLQVVEELSELDHGEWSGLTSPHQFAATDRLARQEPGRRRSRPPPPRADQLAPAAHLGHLIGTLRSSLFRWSLEELSGRGEAQAFVHWHCLATGVDCCAKGPEACRMLRCSLHERRTDPPAPLLGYDEDALDVCR